MRPLSEKEKFDLSVNMRDSHIAALQTACRQIREIATGELPDADKVRVMAIVARTGMTLEERDAEKAKQAA